MHRMVRVSNAAYLKLAETAGKLQFRLRHRVSLSEALDYLVHKKEKRARHFWSKLKEKRAKNVGGRGRHRRPENASLVHSRMNDRREIV